MHDILPGLFYKHTAFFLVGLEHYIPIQLQIKESERSISYVVFLVPAR